MCVASVARRLRICYAALPVMEKFQRCHSFVYDGILFFAIFGMRHIYGCASAIASKLALLSASSYICPRIWDLLAFVAAGPDCTEFSEQLLF